MLTIKEKQVSLGEVTGARTAHSPKLLLFSFSKGQAMLLTPLRAKSIPIKTQKK